MDRSPVLDDTGVTFVLPDRHGRLGAVRLAEEVGAPAPLAFTRTDGMWRLRLPQPDVDRMEYLFELEDHNGNRATVLDPGNPLRAGGAFGDKSVAEFVGYRPPAWLTHDRVAGSLTALEPDALRLDSTLGATVWAPSALAADMPAPLLVVHDGPEYAQLGGFTDYLAASIAAGTLPALRAALLDPGNRNHWYSANPAYAQTLAAALRRLAPTTVTVGIGVSLGAVAMLHAHRAHRAHRAHHGLLDGLLLQSGSFFTPELDPQEAGFSGFAAVTAFTAAMASAGADPCPVPTVITCGTVEENRANNVAMAAALDRLGYPVETVIRRDAHNYTAWRDALDPHLTELVNALVGAHAA